MTNELDLMIDDLSVFEIMQRFRTDGSCEQIIKQALVAVAEHQRLGDEIFQDITEPAAAPVPAEDCTCEYYWHNPQEHDAKCPVSLRAEIERLKAGRFTPEEFQNLCHNTDVQKGREAFVKGCHEYQKLLFDAASAPQGDARSAILAELREKVEGLIKDWRHHYDEELFTPLADGETQKVHERWPGLTDRIAGQSARNTCDHLLADVLQLLK